MKNFYTLFVVVLIGFIGHAQIVNIPDANFKAKLLQASAANQIAVSIVNGQFFKIDANNDGNIQVSEALNVAVLDISNSNITDLTGIVAFSNMQVLIGTNNLLTSLDLGNIPTLDSIYCENNLLTSLNVSGLGVLSNLECSNNQLQSIDLSNNPYLSYVNCDNNLLTTYYGKNGGSYTLSFAANPNLTSMCINTSQGLQIQNLITSYGYTNCTWYADCTFTTSGENDYVPITDANFKAKLLTADTDNEIAKNNNGVAIKVDLNNDGNIQKYEALLVYQLDVNQSIILDISGVEFFTNLTHLRCSNNQLQDINVSNLTSLRILHCGGNQLTQLNLTGLTLITELSCNNNQLTSLNITGQNYLEYLECSYNQFQNIDVNNHNYLQRIHCNNNLLTSISLSGLPALSTFYCGFNQLTNLNLSSVLNIQVLGCRNNQLSTLNVSSFNNLYYLDYSNNLLPNLNLTGLTALKYLYCSSNQIATIDVSTFTALLDLDCSRNLLTSLNITGLTNLQNLVCNQNAITSLNLTGLNQLEKLFCYLNPLGSLNLSGLNELKYLYCFSNNLSTLDLSEVTNLVDLNCGFNQLTTLDLSTLSNLNSADCSNSISLTSIFAKNGAFEGFNIDACPMLQYMCVDESQILEVQNNITFHGYTNCHVNSYCSFTPGGAFYTIEGNNHYDSTNNGCDTNDVSFPNLKLSFSDGTNTGNLIADGTGVYSYDVQAGTHTITPIMENPSYFSITPASSAVTFPNQSSPLTQDFCITANGVHNDLEIVLLPINVSRPGFDANYKIIYKNKGTTIQSGTVSFTYDDSVLDFVVANPSISGQGTDNLNWSFANLLPFESREILITLNLNSPLETPPVNSGNLLIFSANITGNADETVADNTLTFTQTVVNSFDPNDKTCLEGTSITPSMVGKYVHYVIRFENTGTANAENIIVKDIIDTTKFDISSLIPLNGSALYETRIKNSNQVEFIFENISLPFDDANNDGYVAFKIKTLPTLVDGDIFSNSASIYFDYNAPIDTNPYVTTITALGTPNFEFSSLFAISPVPTKNLLNITTKQEIEISSISIYNMLGQLIQVTTNPNESIDTSGLKAGNYFIKIISDKGTVSTKFVKE